MKPTPEQRAAFNAANGSFRQKFGETATQMLRGRLESAGAAPLSGCRSRQAPNWKPDSIRTMGDLIDFALS